MGNPVQPDLERYKTNHRLLAARLRWLWNTFLEYESRASHQRAELEGFVLQVRLACEQYALLMQSACFETLPGSQRSKSKAFDAVKILNEVKLHAPTVLVVPLRDVLIQSDQSAVMQVNESWIVNDGQLKAIYERSGNFLHATNRDFDDRAFENFIANGLNLVLQLILVTWRHVTTLDGLAKLVVSQIMPDDTHMFFVLNATEEHLDRLRGVSLRAAT